MREVEERGVRGSRGEGDLKEAEERGLAILWVFKYMKKITDWVNALNIDYN